MVIGNIIGQFIMVEECTLTTHDRRMPKILVDMDITEGLLDFLDVQWEAGSFTW